MNAAVFGTGMVGQAIAGKLASLGHHVVIGTRDPDASKKRSEGRSPFAAWVADHPDIAVAPYAEAAVGAEMIFIATHGEGSIPALREAAKHLAGTIIVDVSNPLDSASGFPPSFFVTNTDSLAEQIQGSFPDAKVVKTLNTVTASVMVDPSGVGNGDHDVFISGNDADSKAAVAHVLTEGFGWQRVIDLGDISTARGPEMYLALWLRLMMSLGDARFNIKVVR